MLKVSHKEVIEYIKNNIDSCLAFTDIDIDCAKNIMIDGTTLVIPRINVSLDIDYDSFIEYTYKKENVTH